MKHHLQNIALLAAVVLCMPAALWAEGYGLTIAGTAVTSDNAANIEDGDHISSYGTVSYDAATRTLTLDNASISLNTSDDFPAISKPEGDLTIMLEGDNTIALAPDGRPTFWEACAMQLARYNTITSRDGTGKLACSVNESSGAYGVIVSLGGGDGESGMMYVKNCTVTATGDYVIPETVEQDGTAYDVTTIGDAAFQGSSVEAVTIPSTVDYVGERN